jgi:hypothetical protein
MPEESNTPEITPEEAAYQRKLQVLKSLHTNELLAQIPVLMNQYEKAQQEELAYRSENSRYMANPANDCTAVKQVMAEITVPDEDAGKKLSNAPAREAWFNRQRTQNEALKQAIEQQQQTYFYSEQLKIAVEMAHKRLESTKAVLALRTAQLNFLSN